MPIPVTCACGKSVTVKDEWAGRKARCSACQRVLVVPELKKKRPIEDDVVTCEPVDDEDDVVTCEPFEEKKSSIRTAPERGITAKGRPKLADDEDPPPRRSRRDRDEDDYDDERPRSRRDRDRDRDDEDEPRPVRRKRPRVSRGSGSNAAMAGIFGGLGMMILAVVWFFGALYFGYLFYYPPILFVFGIIAFVRGLMGKE